MKAERAPPAWSRSPRSAACSAGPRAPPSRDCFFFSSALGGRPVRPRDLDRPGGVAAMLGPALALGLGHCVMELTRCERVGRARPRSSRSPRAAGRPESRRTRPAAPARRARRPPAGRAGRRPRRRRRAASRGGPRRWSTPGPGRRCSSHSPIARTPGRPSGPALADQRRDRAGVLQRRGRRELDVEGDQRRPRGDERRAGGRVQPRRPEVGAQLAGLRSAARARRGPPRRSSARVRPPASAPYRNTGRSSSCASRSASTSASAHAAPRSPARR